MLESAALTIELRGRYKDQDASVPTAAHLSGHTLDRQELHIVALVAGDLAGGPTDRLSRPSLMRPCPASFPALTASRDAGRIAVPATRDACKASLSSFGRRTERALRFRVRVRVYASSQYRAPRPANHHSIARSDSAVVSCSMRRPPGSRRAAIRRRS